MLCILYHGVFLYDCVFCIAWLYTMHFVSITTTVLNSNPAYGEVYMYLMQHYVIKFVTDLASGRLLVFSGYSGFLH